MPGNSEKSSEKPKPVQTLEEIPKGGRGGQIMF
jgi:hypothetical protein